MQLYTVLRLPIVAIIIIIVNLNAIGDLQNARARNAGMILVTIAKLVVATNI